MTDMTEMLAEVLRAYTSQRRLQWTPFDDEDGAAFILSELSARGLTLLPAEGLEAAWAEVEAALPEGWLMAVEKMPGDGGWYAYADPHPPMDELDDRGGAAIGPNPAAALRALAAALHSESGS